ncbi:phosphate-selective porin O/P [Sediminitomix flava]|uniref:Phosphate-selective porin O/P n=2 Tax=Sediminitomix flava TaxID=379075 RepID=A0A315Z8X5_SEDFL|nr:phosphate-selective porin O/P [Sediminitomix flava]
MCVLGGVFANKLANAQSVEPTQEPDSLAQRIDLLQQEVDQLKQKNDRFNLLINFQGNNRSNFDQNGFVDNKFTIDQFRIEMMGELADGLTYRFRQRINSTSGNGNQDGLSFATDVMELQYEVNDDFRIKFGKQAEMLGGYEFDYNPIDIYQYTLIGNYCKGFLTGVNFSYDIGAQNLNFQIVNADNTLSTDRLPEGVNETGAAMGYNVLWYGSLFDGKLQPIWSYQLYNNYEDAFTKRVNLGFRINQKKPNRFFEFEVYNSSEDVDDMKLVSDVYQQFEGNDNTLMTDVQYYGVVGKYRYAFSDKCHALVKYAYEKANTKDGSFYGETSSTQSDVFTSQTGVVAFEYYPYGYADGFRVHLAVSSQGFNYVDQVNAAGVEDISNSSIMIGVKHRLQLF